MTQKRLGLLDWTFIGTLLVIFGGIVLHAPFSVGFSTLFPDASLIIKSWKEILMGVALLTMAIIMTREKQWQLFHSKLFYVIAAFAAVNLLAIPLFYTGFEATVAGIFINLRFLLYFVLVYAALKLYPQFYKKFLYVAAGGAAVVVGFSALQATVLPHDILKYIGYNNSTIVPFLTVDENMDYIRINGTLRGPNPLGAYAAVVLTLVVTAWLVAGRALKKYEQYLLGFLGIGSIIALWASYSRSAGLAAVIAVAIALFLLYGRRITKTVWVSLIVVALLLGGSLVAFRETQFVSQVILHEDPHEGNDVNSNDGHVESLIDGTDRLSRQPLGAGIGSTGSPSLLTDNPLILENQYLYIAHESGWPGLALFLVINYLVLVGLWQRRAHWLALGVFASGIGLAVAALVLPVWADDTVSIIWWGLAAIALAIPFTTAKRKKNQKKAAV